MSHHQNSRTLRIPLTYGGFPCGFALTEEFLSPVARSVSWTLRIPPAVRRQCHNRFDILLAALREDESIFRRTTPWTQLEAAGSKVQLRLVTLVLRPELIPLIERFAASIDPVERAMIIENAALIAANVGRVVYLNHSRVDVRLANIREVHHDDLEEIFS